MNTIVNMGDRWASEFLEEIQENIQMANLYHPDSLAPEVENQEGRRTQSLKGLILLQKLSVQLKSQQGLDLMDYTTLPRSYWSITMRC